jgi:hypothetical protein
MTTKEKGLASKVPKAPSSVGLFTGRSFADVIQVVLGVEVRKPKPVSSCFLDVLPTSDGLGKGCGGDEMHMAVDC